MIQILEPKECCGCTACVQICPVGCISLYNDSEGFAYPFVDIDACVGCGQCETVCPILNSKRINSPIDAYAVKACCEKVRESSSSGGVFTLLAEKILRMDGIVFGVEFDENWNVVHSYVDKECDLVRFRESKYVQSDVNASYQKVESFLKEGRIVLFSGTPCQISALRCYLHEDYSNLYFLDFACHGVPSPGIWKKYLNEIKSELEMKIHRDYPSASMFASPFIEKIRFRDKITGWKSYSVSIQARSRIDSKDVKIHFSQKHRENSYMQAFLSNLSLRPSCYDCHARLGYSGSDLTIADFWGIEHVLPEFFDDKGVSLVIVNSVKGDSLFSDVDAFKERVSLPDILKYNCCLTTSVKMPSARSHFFQMIREGRTISASLRSSLRKPFINKVFLFTKNYIVGIIKRLR